MIGEAAVTVGDLNQSGTVRVRGEFWRAQSSVRVPGSAPVRITGIDGLTLQVEPIVGEQKNSGWASTNKELQ
jgi:membrane-bound serine protease (ClpP class)